MNNGIDDGDKAQQCHHRSHLDAHGAENIGIESGLGGTGPAHQHKTDDDNQHADSQQDEVGLAES